MKKTSRHFPTKLIAYTALMTALTYVGTLLGFSGGQFYFNLGDTVILVCAYLFGPIPAMLAGGLGAFLGDLTVYPATMLYTLVIKAIEGLVAGLLFILLKKVCAKYLASHMTSAMKEYMASHPTRNVGQTGDAASPNNENSDGTQAGEPAFEESSADVEGALAQSEHEGAFKTRSVKLSQTDEISQCDVEVSNSKSKTSVYDKIRIVKRRLLAITYGLSFPICLFCTAIMMVGYFIAQAFIYGTYAAALVALPMDAVQAVISSVVATEIIALLSTRSK